MTDASLEEGQVVEEPITFAAEEEGDGVVVTDTVERRRVLLGTDRPVEPTPAEESSFLFPVDAAARLGTASVSLPKVVATYVRDGTDLLAELGHNETRSFEGGEYLLELEASIKLYLAVSGPVTVSVTGTYTEVSAESGPVVVGARSYHRQPQTAVTTTSDPADMMAAISTFGSALKTTSVERSYPTLRGHPPTVELGDSLGIPEGIEPPDTGITVELPPEREYVYPAAPLSYYLGATAEPGSAPRLRTDSGFEHRLDGDDGFDVAAERVLKQVFLLDCLTRTEGFYPVDLHERRALSGLDLDFERLYDLSPAERLASYLSVSYERLREHVPKWPVTGHLSAAPENARLLPFLVDDLAAVRRPRAERVTAADVELSSIRRFTRSGNVARGGAEQERLTFVRPERDGSLEHVWAAEGAPVGATKASLSAYRNRLQRSASEGDIGVTVVCNDPEMLEETERAEALYGDEAELPFDVRTYQDISRAALRAVIETDRDFLHYIGHIDAAGFQCSDGRLDVRELDRVGVDGFLLNACSSYEQGMAMLDRGAITGVVTLSDVINSGAVRIGKAMARLLDNGFPVNAALEVARDESIVGGQYIVVGDGSVDLVQTVSRFPMVLEVESLDSGYRLTPVSFTTNNAGVGGMASVYNGEQGVRYLVPGPLDTFELSEDQLEETLSLETLPVRFDGELRWSDELSS